MCVCELSCLVFCRACYFCSLAISRSIGHSSSSGSSCICLVIVTCFFPAGVVDVFPCVSPVFLSYVVLFVQDPPPCFVLVEGRIQSVLPVGMLCVSVLYVWLI